MAKKKQASKKQFDMKAIAKHTEEVLITKTLEDNFMPYAMSVIISRAIPEIDGFKPSHRKLLYTMYKMGLLTGTKTKSANIVGQTMKLNPHGDQAIYETMVRLTRGNEALLHPLIDSKGNFGKQYSKEMKYAASRYTEAKLDKICEEVFNNIDKNTVDFVDNYDSSLKEPTLLPVSFPNILVNPNLGIAVGMASNFCSFNLEEICNTTIALMKNPDMEESMLLPYLKGPDFPTGGQLIFKEKELLEIYKTGKGSFRVRGKYTFFKESGCVEITEIPYSTTSEAVIDAIAALVKSGKIKEITDVRDETDLNGLKITLDVRKSADIETLMKKLYKLTPLEDSFSCNFNLLINGKPKQLGVKSILQEWILFRTDCVKRQTKFDIEKLSDKLHLLLGLQKILLDIDKAIRIVRNTEEDALVIPNLMEGFDIDKLQAEYVAEIKLRNLNKQYILNRISEIESLEKQIADLKELYGSEIKIKNFIAKQLAEVIKKYKIDRKTEIVHEDDVEIFTDDHMIEDYNCRLFLSDHGYLKKIPLTSLRSNPEQKTKEEDFISQCIETHNKADVLFFSNKQICYKCRIYDLAEQKPSSLGDYLNNLLGMDQDEKILFMHATDDYSGHMLFCFENGKISKIPLEGYATKTNRKKLANAYSDKAPVCAILHIGEERELVAFSSIQKVLVFHTDMLNPISTRTSQGVQVLKAKKGSVMSNVTSVEESGLVNIPYYKCKNVPGIGAYLREQDIEDNQIKLDIN